MVAKNAAILHLSDRSAQKRLHANSAVPSMQILNEEDWANCRACCNKLIFIYLAVKTGKIFAIEHEKVGGSFIKHHFTAQMLPFAVLLDHLAFGVLTFYDEGVESINMLYNCLEPRFRQLKHLDIWFQQDKVTTTARRSMNEVRKMLPEYTIWLHLETFSIPTLTPQPHLNSEFNFRRHNVIDTFCLQI